LYLVESYEVLTYKKFNLFSRKGQKKLQFQLDIYLPSIFYSSLVIEVTNLLRN